MKTTYWQSIDHESGLIRKVSSRQVTCLRPEGYKHLSVFYPKEFIAYTKGNKVFRKLTKAAAKVVLKKWGHSL